MTRHTTNVQQGSRVRAEDGTTASWWRPRCSCGWIGRAAASRGRAEILADEHVLSAIEYDDAIR